ncbi:MAG: prepilin-type N-terminal cleavage/methylation domain-containing protein [Halobacteriovoraceae bacterium]|nr:prepilin-type N-terminal cleavage/methylation domain-containing protein [Halobacteriovoraceae bacterium]
MGNYGFTLLEVIITLRIMTIETLGLSQLFLSTQNITIE